MRLTASPSAVPADYCIGAGWAGPAQELPPAALRRRGVRTAKIARLAAAGSLAIALMFSAACGTSVNGSAETSSSVSTADSVSTGTRADTDQDYHPSGFTVPQGANVRLPTERGELTMKVGSYFVVKPQEWFPDNDGSRGIGGVLQLAEATPDQLTYQAIAPGEVTFTIGPVGHPGGCDQPGKSCADATPPPTVQITVTG